MAEVVLTQVAIFLGAAAIAAPLAKRFHLGSVLGYLLAGVLIGPFGIGLIYSVYEVESILQIAEFGVVMLLFIIGLELRPMRLWSMRRSIFGLGSAQIFLTALCLFAGAMTFGLTVGQSIFVGLALSLSSTAFALQILEEKGELSARHGRLAFSILLFQDLAAIPMIALVPIFAPPGEGEGAINFAYIIRAVVTVGIIILAGQYLLNRIFRIVASSKVKEAMVASALLTVVGVALLMEYAGLSAALGAFIAGALLADSEYRHEIEANIAPFEGLLLGLFFTAIGMHLNLNLLFEKTATVFLLVAGIVAIKFVILFALGRFAGLEIRTSRRLGIVLSQDGEFAFVLLASAVTFSVVNAELAALLAVVVTLSMIATPVLLTLDDYFTKGKKSPEPVFETPGKNEGHIIIAGFGRFGQITARILTAKGIPFTALDTSSERVDFVRKFGAKLYYGDPSRPNILRAAQADKAKCFVLAIDDVESSLKTAQMVIRNYPDLPIYARARDRRHAHRLMDIGVKSIFRETFYSSLRLSHEVLRGYGLPENETRRLIETFRIYDQKRLYDDYEHFSDMEKLQLQARKSAAELEELFRQDLEEYEVNEEESSK